MEEICMKMRILPFQPLWLIVVWFIITFWFRPLAEAAGTLSDREQQCSLPLLGPGFGSVKQRSAGLFPVRSDWATFQWHDRFVAPVGSRPVFCSSSAEMFHWQKCSPTPERSCCLPKIGIIPAARPPSQCHSSFKWPDVRERSSPGSEPCVSSNGAGSCFCSVFFDAGHIMVFCSSACAP